MFIFPVWRGIKRPPFKGPRSIQKICQANVWTIALTSFVGKENCWAVPSVAQKNGDIASGKMNVSITCMGSATLKLCPFCCHISFSMFRLEKGRVPSATPVVWFLTHALGDIQAVSLPQTGSTFHRFWTRFWLCYPWISIIWRKAIWRICLNCHQLVWISEALRISLLIFWPNSIWLGEWTFFTNLVRILLGRAG